MHPNYGIYRFKTELGARLCLYAGYYDRVYSTAAYHVARRLERWTLRYGRRCAAAVQTAWHAVPRWATRTAPVASLGLA
jgi:hypothetical protein